MNHSELIENWQRMDAASRQANTEAWLAELATWRQRAEAAEAKLEHAYQENDALVAQHNEIDDLLTAATARAEAAEAKLARVDQYAAYYNTVASKGDAPETFTDWLGGAANWSHYRSEVQ